MKTDPIAGVVLKAAPADSVLVRGPDLTITKISVKGPLGAVETASADSLSEKVIASHSKSKLGAGQNAVSR